MININKQILNECLKKSIRLGYFSLRSIWSALTESLTNILRRRGLIHRRTDILRSRWIDSLTDTGRGWLINIWRRVRIGMTRSLMNVLWRARLTESLGWILRSLLVHPLGGRSRLIKHIIKSRERSDERRHHEERLIG